MVGCFEPFISLPHNSFTCDWNGQMTALSMSDFMEMRQDSIPDKPSIFIRGEDLGRKRIIKNKKDFRLSQVVALRMRNMDGGDTVLDLLSKSSHVSNLEDISIVNSGVTDYGMRLLSASTFLTSLTGLDVSFNEISDVGVAYLCASNLVTKLTYLDLAYNEISDRGAMLLVEQQKQQHLEQTNVWGNDVEPALLSMLDSLHDD